MKKQAALAIVALLLASSGAGVLRSAQQEPANLKEVSVARVKLARRAFENASASIDQFVAQDPARVDSRAPRDLNILVEGLIAWSNRWSDSERDADATPKSDAVAVNSHIERLRKVATTLEAHAGSRTGVTQLPIDLLNYSILEAKAQLLKMDAKP